MEVGNERVEQSRAVMIELFPGGFEEIDREGSTELVAYTDAGGEERVWHAFGGAHGADVEQGWEDRWRDFHKPVRVGSLWVGPPWETAPSDALAVVIDPGRAFGTGAHATTQLCLELLQELEPGSLLDVGCGSGVLSIAAALLGFEPVIALDSDPHAVEATRENAERNGVVLDVRHHDALDEPVPSAGSAVANITAEAVRELAPRLEVSRLLTSGYLVSEQVAVEGFRALDRRVRDGWAADLSRRETG